MHALRQPARRQPRSRGGFTLIELLVVIVIIGILAALLIPVLSSAMRTTREATVTVEMSNFDKALVEFKNRYGVEVPSFIVLYEQGDAVGTTPCWAVDTSSPLPGTQDSYRRTSRAFIRQVWPDFDFASLGDSAANPLAPGPGNPVSGNSSIDLNGNGVETDVLVLNGSECLVFFLGGVVRRGAIPFPAVAPFPPISETMADDALVGFAANPQNPFDTTSTNNRVGPLFDGFAVDRFTDLDNDGMPEYRDGLTAQQRPYVYVSSYGGAGYKPWGADVTQGNADDEIDPSLGLTDAYRKDDGAPTVGPYLNPQSYQLISPGSDFEYGLGGEYNGTAVDASTNPARAAERDNIANFKGGRLN